MKKILQKGFTLVELLIVIGILGILIAAVLFTLNPAEGQRKARDVQRVKDLGTIQTVAEQLVSANVFTADVNLTSAATNGDTKCGVTNWLGVDVCNYTSTLPADPVNKSTTIAGTAGNGGCTAADTASADAFYYFSYDSASNTYEVGAVQESVSGCDRLTGDGGNSDSMIEVGTTGTFTLIGDPSNFVANP